MTKIIKGTADTARVITGKVDVGSDPSKSIAAIAKAVGLSPAADPSEIRAAVERVLGTRDIELGLRRLGASPRQAKALAAMPPTMTNSTQRNR